MAMEFELKVSNPIVVTVHDESNKINSIVNPMPVPWRIKESTYSPQLYKSNEELPTRVVKYDVRGLHIWRALTSFSHTLIGDMDTWYHLMILTVICFITMGITIGSGSSQSIGNTVDVGTRSQILVSFVLAGYVTIVVNRWDRIRNVSLGQLWGALENLNQLSCEYIHLRHGFGAQEVELSDRYIRYCRLVMYLMFFGIRKEEDLKALIEKKVLLDSEKTCLEMVGPGLRPYMVCGWMHIYFDTLRENNYECSHKTDLLLSNLHSLRGGIGSTMGIVGTPLPYPYVHIIYWIVQMSLVILAVETGVHLAIYDFTKKNGESLNYVYID